MLRAMAATSSNSGFAWVMPKLSATLTRTCPQAVDTKTLGDLDAHLSPGCGYFAHGWLQKVFFTAAHAQAVGGGQGKYLLGHVCGVLVLAQHGQHLTGSALLHGSRNSVYVQRTCGKQLLAGQSQRFGGHVIQIADEFGDSAVCLRFGLTQKGAHAVCLLLKLLGTDAGQSQRFGGHVIQIADEFGDSAVCLRFGLTQKGAHAVCLLLKLLGTDADTYLLGAHDRHFFERISKMGQQSRTSRGAQLTLHAAAIDRNPSQQIGGCRCRYGHDAVCAAHRTAPHMYRRDDHTVDAQKIHRVAHAGHVCDRVQRTNFVIVHVAHWAAVRLGLGLCNGIINRTCVLLDCVRQVQTVCDRVQRTNFVIVHVAHWAAVRLGLGLCNGIINRTCVLLDCVRQVQTINDRRDMTGRCMVVMVAVFMLVMVLMLVIIVMMVVLVVMVIMVMVVVVVMIPMMMVRCMVVMVAVFMLVMVLMLVIIVMMVVLVVMVIMVMVVVVVMIPMMMVMMVLVVVIIMVVVMVFLFMIIMMMIMVVVVLMRVRLVFLFPMYGHTHVRTRDAAGLSRFGCHLLVVVLMRVRLVFLFPMYGHTHVRTRDAAGLSRFGCHLHAVQAQFLHFLQKCRLIIQ